MTVGGEQGLERVESTQARGVTDVHGGATMEQFEGALAAVRKGPLPSAALERLSALQQAFLGEPR